MFAMQDKVAQLGTDLQVAQSSVKSLTDERLHLPDRTPHPLAILLHSIFNVYAMTITETSSCCQGCALIDLFRNLVILMHNSDPFENLN